MKTYRAIRHDVKRAKLRANEDSHHHPQEKISQIRQCLDLFEGKIKTLELFAGQGNLTKLYAEYGEVEAYDKKYLKTGDSFLLFHKLIYEKKTYDVIDIDPYGFPNRFYPDIYLLINKGYMFVTMPKPYCNMFNDMTATNLISYYGVHNPSEIEVVERMALWGLCHWRKVELISSLDLKSVWRFAFHVEKVKATEYTGSINRPQKVEKKVEPIPIETEIWEP